MDLVAGDDGELLRLVRAGEDAAFGELFVRHSPAVRGYALRCCADVAEAEDMAAEAFFRAFQAIRRGSGPQDNVRAYLLTVVRRLAGEWSVRRRDVPVADDELDRQVDAGYAAPASRADLQLIATAFTTLPRRWRAVLWQVEVEGERPAVVASHFGLSANATAALARRARQGLRAAYLQAHVGRGATHGCRAVVAKLGAYTAGQVTGAEHARIRRHLAGCPACERLQAELRDVCDGLRRHAGTPMLAGAAAGLGKAGGVKVTIGAAGLVTRWAGHLGAAGARAKLAVAAVSVAAVGGFGVVAGPLLTHIDPSPPNADRGIAIGPLLTTTGTTSTPAFPQVTGSRRFAGAFEAAPRHIVFVPHHLRREEDGPVPAATAISRGGSTGTPGATVPMTEPMTEPMSEPISEPTTESTSGPMRSIQLQDADATPQPDSSQPQSQQPTGDPTPLLGSQPPSVTGVSTTAVTPISPGPTSGALVP